MRPRHRIGFSMVSILLFVCCPPILAEDETWKVGLASSKITPDQPLWMAGYGGRDRPAEGTLHDLWIKALALEDTDGNRAVVLTSDLLGFPKRMADTICAELKTQCGLNRSQIMLTASHTHSGPVLEGALVDIYPLDDHQRQLITAYSRGLERTVVETIVKAFDQGSPATLWAGEGAVDFAVNRRNNPQSQVRQLLEAGTPLKGPADHSVPVLAVRGPEDELRAVVFGYACHATTLSLCQWSGDYPGFAQIALEQDLPGTLAMFHAGCGADQNPLPRRSIALCGKYGFSLADAVQEVLGKPMRPIPPVLETAFEIVDLAYEKTLSREELEAGLAKNVYYRRRAERLLKDLDEGHTLASSYPYPVQVWQMGDQQLWITLGGEVVVDYSLRFKAEFGARTWISGYCNDVMSYIPSSRVREEGGYESGAFYVYGLPTERWAPEIEPRVAASVRGLAEILDEDVGDLWDESPVGSPGGLQNETVTGVPK